MTFTIREKALLSNTDVLGYIQARNAERNAQAIAEGWEFWTTLAESLADDHANVYELEHRLAWGTYSDVYKEAYFSRPNVDFSGVTLEEIERRIEAIYESEARAEKAEREWEAELDKSTREEVALGMKRPASDMKLEQWEIYEAKAESEGY